MSKSPEEQAPAPGGGPPGGPAIAPARFAPLAAGKPEGGAAPARENLNLLLDIAVPIAVEIGRAQLRIEEILNLGPGAVVELDKLAGEPMDFYVNGKLLAQGEVVVVDDNFGIRITSIVDPEQRLRGLRGG
jgi:flagellar motor switch protein FliN/FliY